jgi:hypothetical protein
MRRSRFLFCLSLWLQFIYGYFPKSFVRTLQIKGHLDRVRSSQGFCIRFSSCVPGNLSKGSSIESINTSPICGNCRKVLLNYFLELIGCRIKRYRRHMEISKRLLGLFAR